MPQLHIFQWRTGKGWLVLSGGGPWASEDVISIEASVLARTLSQGPVAYVWAAGDIETADRHMDALRELGARTGYLTDILTETDDMLFRQLSEAGVIILGDGPQVQTLHEGLVGTALRGIEAAFDLGATVYAIGQSATLWGAHVIQGNKLVVGFGWLGHSMMMSGYNAEQAQQLRDWVHQQPGIYGLGLGTGSALALGPGDEVEVWGNSAITVSLAQHFELDSEKGD